MRLRVAEEQHICPHYHHGLFLTHAKVSLRFDPEPPRGPGDEELYQFHACRRFRFTRRSDAAKPLQLDQIPLKRGYLTGAPGVVWKPPNSFRPSDMVTTPALATLLPSFERYPSTVT
jgi:hypothetical protein